MFGRVREKDRLYGMIVSEARPHLQASFSSPKSPHQSTFPSAKTPYSWGIQRENGPRQDTLHLPDTHHKGGKDHPYSGVKVSSAVLRVVTLNTSRYKECVVTTRELYRPRNAVHGETLTAHQPHSAPIPLHTRSEPTATAEIQSWCADTSA